MGQINKSLDPPILLLNNVLLFAVHPDLPGGIHITISDQNCLCLACYPFIILDFVNQMIFCERCNLCGFSLRIFFRLSCAFLPFKSVFYMWTIKTQHSYLSPPNQNIPHLQEYLCRYICVTFFFKVKLRVNRNVHECKNITGLEKCYGYIYVHLVVLGLLLQDNVGRCLRRTATTQTDIAKKLSE
jgi:hypothetical protein